MVRRRLWEGVARVALGAVLFVAPGGATAGVRLAGKVALFTAGEAEPSGTVTNTVVYFKPHHATTVRPASKVPEIVMHHKEFVPHVLTVTVGSQVRFPNADPILHNVFSVSGPNSFDLGLYPEGPGKTIRFAEPGLVRVFCNVHQDMVAYVLVLDTPYFVSPGTDGSFEFADLPETDGLLVVWHERAEPWSRELRPPLGEPLEVRLEVTKPLVPPHADKHGKPYARTDGDANSYR